MKPAKVCAMPPFSIKELTVFITGTNKQKGIGRALVEEALQRGAKKVYATARDILQLEDLVANHKGKVVPIALDVTDIKQIQEVAKEARDTQVLINNAGVSSISGCLAGYDTQVAHQEMAVNYFAPLHLIQAFSNSLIKNTRSAIVNIISIAGLYPAPTYVTYSASKAALRSLTQALRIEMARKGHNIPVFGVYPGPIDTAMLHNVETQKEKPLNVARRVFEGMQQGVLDITTDPLSDHFADFLTQDANALNALKQKVF